MTITLSSKARKLLKERLDSGRYASAEDVVLAGLASLRQQDELGHFAPGELERLVGEGERSIERDGVVDAEPPSIVQTQVILLAPYSMATRLGSFGFSLRGM